VTEPAQRDGERVRLRDVTLGDADLLDAWNADPTTAGEFNDFGGSPKPTDRDALARGPLRNERNGQLMIERIADGQPIGVVGWHLVGYGPNAESGAWNVGIALLPGARGHGFGAEAQSLLAAYLFESTEVNRVEAQTDVDNIAEQRALEKAGFTREGTARGAQFRAGAYHDLVTYSILRDDRSGAPSVEPAERSRTDR
jgi:RimJ/RimL family protein N-acetyltransferase